MFINSKEDLINYFHQGAKKDLLIGVENEKFLFDGSTNSRATYQKINQVLNYLKKFDWKEIKEGKNIIGLSQNGKNISLEPGNQIELAGTKLKNIHEICSESFVFSSSFFSALDCDFIFLIPPRHKSRALPVRFSLACNRNGGTAESAFAIFSPSVEERG